MGTRRGNCSAPRACADSRRVSNARGVCGELGGPVYWGGERNAEAQDVRATRADLARLACYIKGDLGGRGWHEGLHCFTCFALTLTVALVTTRSAAASVTNRSVERHIVPEMQPRPAGINCIRGYVHKGHTRTRPRTRVAEHTYY